MERRRIIHCDSYDECNIKFYLCKCILLANDLRQLYKFYYYVIYFCLDVLSDYHCHYIIKKLHKVCLLILAKSFFFLFIVHKFSNISFHLSYSKNLCIYICAYVCVYVYIHVYYAHFFH